MINDLYLSPIANELHIMALNENNPDKVKTLNRLISKYEKVYRKNHRREFLKVIK